MHKGEVKAHNGNGKTISTFFLPFVFDSLKLPNEEIIEVVKNLFEKGADIRLIAEATDKTLLNKW